MEDFNENELKGVLTTSKRSTKIDCSDKVNEYIDGIDWRIFANSNTGYTHAGLINNLAGGVIANFWLDSVYSKEEGDAHRNGDYHIHDLDNLAGYCFTGDTKIRVVFDENPMEVQTRSLEWLAAYKKPFKVYTMVVTTGHEHPCYGCRTSKAINCRQTRITKVVKLTFNNNSNDTVRCTPDHKFRLVNGDWVEAKDLTPDMKLLTLTMSDYHVTSIEEIDEPQHVYCLEELDTGTHSFALSNGVIVHNCCGHDLQKLLDEGFNGVMGRVGSKPPKHLREALYQMANFIGILQSEWAGAQAFSSFDTYLAPYVFFDKYYGGMSEDDVKKAIRNFVYNLNVPSRWGQCVPETYRCLKADGTWASYKDLKIGDEIYVVDMETGKLKKDKLTHINVFDAPKKMHRYKNEQGFNFCVTDKHRVINKTGSNKWRISESSQLLNLSGPIYIPIATWNKVDKESYMGEEYEIEDELLEFITYIMTDGCIYKQEDKTPVIRWYKSDSRYGVERFEELCSILGIEYSKSVDKGGFNSLTNCYTLHRCEKTDKVLSLLSSSKSAFPSFVLKLSPRQCYIILDNWVLLDGSFDGVHWRMQADNNSIQETLAYLAIKSGKAVSISERIVGDNKTATKYTNIHKRLSRACKVYEEENEKYNQVWCPTTDTGTFVCMTDEGYVFFTGNSPFSNVTIDWYVPELLRDKIPSRSGENFFLNAFKEIEEHNPDYRNSDGYRRFIEEVRSRLGELATGDDELDLMGMSYSMFQKEMHIINRCYYEVLNEGDVYGQPFTFPIPTINITEDFDWYGENTDLLFENAAKYGSSYFQNFIGSQYMIDENGIKVKDPTAYSPKDLRSMCPLTVDTQLVIKRPVRKDITFDDGKTMDVIDYVEKTVTIKELYDNYDSYKDCGINSISLSGEFSSAPFTKFRPNKQQKQKVYSIKLDCDGVEKEIKMGQYHIQPVISNSSYFNDPFDISCERMKKYYDDGYKYKLPVFCGVMGDDGTAIIKWCDIKSFEEIEYNDDLYCIEIIRDETNSSYFAIKNGIITHNCRLSLDLKALRKKGGGLFGASSNTGSIGVITLNMARLGYTNKGDVENFYKELDRLLELGKSSLEKKRKVVSILLERGLYPYTKRYIMNGYDNFFSTIGVNGMNEMIRNFTNDEHDIADEWGQEFAKNVLDHIREKLITFQEETGNLYNLEATPAEGTTYRFVRADLKKFPKRKVKYIECEKHGKVEITKKDIDENGEAICPLCHKC